MAEKPTDYWRYAGRVLFPRTPDDLTAVDRCPACLTPTTGPVCASCGLNLAHPAVAELSTLSTDAAALLDRRLDVIGRIRYDTEQEAEAEAAAASRAFVDDAIAAPTALRQLQGPESSAQGPESTAQGPVGSSRSPAAAPGPASPPAAPGRSGIQVLLVVVGISLLSIAAIFFLVYAFITWGLLARSIIIGAITLAAIVSASVLRRRRLPATAEGVSMFAIVLLYLDAFALRGNDMFGAAAADASAYWGWTLVITAVGFVAWSRLSPLRTPGIVGFATFAPGVALVAGTLTTGSASTFVFAAALTIAAGVHRLAPRLLGRPAPVERTVALIIAAIGIVLASIAAFGVGAGTTWGVTVALLLVALLAAGQLALLDLHSSPSRVGTGFGMVFAIVGAAALTAALPAGIWAIGNATAVIVFPLLLGTVVTLLVEVLWRLSRGTAAAPHLRAAFVSSAVTTLIVGLPALATLVFSTLVPPVLGLVRPWTLSPTDPIAFTLPVSALAALGSVTGAALLVAGAWWFGGVIRRRLPALVWSACGILLAAAALLPALWAILTGWEALAFAAVVAVTVTDARGRLIPSVRAALLSTAFAASALAYASSWASMDTWQLVTLAVILVLVTSRLFFAGAARSTLLGIAVSLFVIMGAAGARDLALPLHPSANADLVNVFRATGFVGILLLGLVALLRVPAIRPLDRRLVFWIAATVITGSTVVSQTALLTSGRQDVPGRLLPEYATSAAVSVFLGAALLCWAMARAPRRFRLERTIAVAALPLALYWFVDALARALDADASLLALAPATAAVIGAAASLALDGTRFAPVLPRRALDVGVVLVALAALLTPALVDSESEWVALIISAVTALLLAIDRDGLFGSVSPRRHLGWLALLLASAGLWLGLAQADVRAVEAYVLPVAGALLIIAALAALAAAGAPGSGASESAPLTAATPTPVPQSVSMSESMSGHSSRTVAIAAIALGGLLLAIVPEALVGASGPIARPIIVGALSAVLLLASSFARWAGPAQRYLDAAAIAGALGVTIDTLTRAISVLADGGARPADARLEAWLVPGITTLVVASIGQASVGRTQVERGSVEQGSVKQGSVEQGSVGPGGPAASPRAIVAQAALALSLLVAVVLELPALYPDGGGFARAATLTVLLCAALVVAVAIPRPPLTVPVGWLAFALAALVGATALVTGAFGELELMTVPLAAALIAVGGIRLHRSPSARTWPTLAPGVAVLLVPSLVVTAVDAPLWRLVGLGVVSIAVLVVSVVLRLQAPLLISAVVLLVHAIVTFAPGIVAVYQAVEWWLWLAIGGVIVLVISIRFESSRRGVKAAIGRIAALR